MDAVIKTLTEKGLISPAQMTDALAYQCRLPNGKEMPIQDILVAFEYITQHELDSIINERNKKATPPQANNAPPQEETDASWNLIKNALQKTPPKEEPAPKPAETALSGELLVSLGLIEDWQLSHALCQSQSQPNQTLEQALIELGYSSQEVIDAAVIMHKRRTP